MGCTLYICQGGEVISDGSKACQNLKNKIRQSNEKKPQEPLVV